MRCLTAGTVSVLWVLSGAMASAESLDSLAWLCGSWGDPDDTVETWMEPKDGLLLGINRAARTDQTPFFEYLRIEERIDGVFYLASPLGREPVAFRMTKNADRRVVFENPEHDFPQRIEYRLEGATLVAKISAGDGKEHRGQAFEWPRLSTCTCGYALEKAMGHVSSSDRHVRPSGL